MSTVKVNVIMHLPVSYKLSCIDKFMYMQACLASSIIICFARNYPDGYGLTSFAQHSVINIADITSAFDKTLVSERFRRKAVDGAP